MAHSNRVARVGKKTKRQIFVDNSFTFIHSYRMHRLRITELTKLAANPEQRA